MKKTGKKITVLISAIPFLAKAGGGLVGAVVIIVTFCIAGYFICSVLHPKISEDTAKYDGTVGVELTTQEMDPVSQAMVWYTVAMGMCAYDFMPLVSEPVQASPADETSPACFAFLYGMDNTNEAWATSGQFNPTVDDPTAGFALNIISDNGTQGVYTVSIDGQLMTWCFTNKSSTNDSGQYSFAPVYPVIIERTTNWMTWQPLRTNQPGIAVGTVNQFTDFDGPFNQAFYRVRRYYP
jgi:hypothetical protein